MSDRIRLLHVEDSPSDAYIVRRALQGLPIDYSLTEDLPDAPMLGIDVVLLDLFLPSSDGTATIKAARKLFAHSSIVVLSSQAEALRATLDATCSAILSKSDVSPTLLLDAIGDAVDKSSALLLDVARTRRLMDDMAKTISNASRSA